MSESDHADPLDAELLNSQGFWALVVGVANVVLVALTIANVRATNKAANAASDSAAHAATAAEAARRQADATDRAEAFAVLPVIVFQQVSFRPAGTEEAALVCRPTNFGRGVALNVRYRLWVRGWETHDEVGEPAFPPGAETDERNITWPEPRATEPGGEYAMEARYRDTTGREYLAVTDNKGVTVSLWVTGEDGAERAAEPLISYKGAFD